MTYLYDLADKISLVHFNTLILLGIVLFGGIAAAGLFQKLKIPQVVGYIITGIIIGKSGLHLIDEKVIESFKFFNYFALGIIGFMVGGELTKEKFEKYGKKLIYILLCEGITPFILVTLFVGITGTLLFGPKPYVWALGLLMGAIASATDPASTTSVIKEYKSKGPLTTNILGIVALDDGLALFLFAIATSIAGALVGHGGKGILNLIIHPFYEIFGAIAIGMFSGFLLNRLMVKVQDKEKLLVLSLGTVLFVTGLSLAAHVSLLLAAMTLGTFIINFRPFRSKEIFNLVEAFAPPLFILFFVLVGTRLEFNHLNKPVLALISVYLVCGLGGKIIGAKAGAILSRSPRPVVKYLPYTLFSQAGIAIGLSILAAQIFHNDIGHTLIIVITATTFITQLIGPSCVKAALSKAGELGLNITEEDIINKSTASDIMDTNPSLIGEDMGLKDILKIFSDNESLYYPVVDKGSQLLGVITVEGIKQTLFEVGIEDLILADDLMENVPVKVNPETPLIEVKDLLDKFGVEFLPVVNANDKVEGFIERKMVGRFISARFIELEQQVNHLENS